MNAMHEYDPDTTTQDGHWLTRQNVVAGVLIVVTAGVFLLCYAMLRPFLSAFAWALALAVMAHPIHHWIEKRVVNANLAAGLSVIIVTAILIIPTGIVLQRLMSEAATHVELIKVSDAADKWRETLESSSIGQDVLWLDERLQLTEQLGGMRQEIAQRMTDILRESIWTIVNVLITIFSLFFMFRDRRHALHALTALSPLSRAECADVFARVGDTIYATVYGSVTMAMIQGALGGLMFWWLGLPAPVLWGVVMALLATVPNLGAFVVWAPAAVGLALQGQTQEAIILAVWGMTAIALIDNLLYPVMVGKRMQMHSAVVFFAIVGGLIVFGPAGLILGPVVFAVAEALIEIWRRRTLNGQGAECPRSPIVLAGEASQPAKQLVS